MQLALETRQVFAFLETAYRMGVLDKFMPVFSESLEGLKKKTGLDMQDILNEMDGAREETIEKMDRFLGRLELPLRLGTNDRLMGLISRLLDFQVGRRVVRLGLQKYLNKVLAVGEGKLPPPSEKPKGCLASAGEKVGPAAGKQT